MEQSQPNMGRSFPLGKREWIFGGLLCAVCLLMVNCLFFGGLNLGFAIAYSLCVLCSGGYLLHSGRKPTAYSITLLILSIVISASFARSGDAPVKFIMACFLFFATNLGLSLLAGKNQFLPGSVSSLGDAFISFFGLGVGEMGTVSRGLGEAFRRSGSVGQKSSAILLGLGIAAPVLLIIIPLLIQADAAFEGLLRYLPEFSVGEFIMTVLFGFSLAFVLFSRNTALQHKQSQPAPAIPRKGMSPLTVNTLLVAICFVYCVYLVSQLAYFTGGFAGTLPADYTLAEYARRGFFEMAWLCAINLGIIIFCLSLCRTETVAPLLTRLLCLFLGIVTLFLVATASAKMIFYIQSYGLTRLRVLTQVVMVFFGIVTGLVCVWLFVPKLPYMKAVLIAALVIGAAVSWADVDTLVASYNVDRYLSGNTETVDVQYLNDLGNSAVPYIELLAKKAPDANTRDHAQIVLDNWWVAAPEDFRSWNYVNHIAAEILPDPPLEIGDSEYLS